MRSKYNIEIIRDGYWNKDGCIPGIENGTWVDTGPVIYQVVGPRGGIKAEFYSKEDAKVFIANLVTSK